MKKTKRILPGFLGLALAFSSLPCFSLAWRTVPILAASSNQSQGFVWTLEESIVRYYRESGLDRAIYPEELIHVWQNYRTFSLDQQKQLDHLISSHRGFENLREMITCSIYFFNLTNTDLSRARSLDQSLSSLNASFPQILKDPSLQESYRKRLEEKESLPLELILSIQTPYQPSVSLDGISLEDLYRDRGGEAAGEDLQEGYDTPLDSDPVIPEQEEPVLEQETLIDYDPAMDSWIADDQPWLSDLPIDDTPAVEEEPDWIPEIPVADPSQPLQPDESLQGFQFEIWREELENRLLEKDLYDPYLLLSVYKEYQTLNAEEQAQIDAFFQEKTGLETFREVFLSSIDQYQQEHTEDPQAIEQLDHALAPYREELDLDPILQEPQDSESASRPDQSTHENNKDTTTVISTVPVINNVQNSAILKNTKIISKEKNRKIKIAGLGTINLLPDFSDAQAWRASSSSYNTPLLWGQCTWFAWGRFYEIYGFDPGFTGNGYECAKQLVTAHPTEFKLSKNPQAGAVFSSDAAHNHVGIVLSYDETTKRMMIQEGNLDVVSNPVWSEAIEDWRTLELTLDQLRDLYGEVIFANPLISLEEQAEEKTVKVEKTDNPEKIADVNALVEELDPLAISRYSSEVKNSFD